MSNLLSRLRGERATFPICFRTDQLATLNARAQAWNVSLSYLCEKLFAHYIDHPEILGPGGVKP